MVSMSFSVCAAFSASERFEVRGVLVKSLVLGLWVCFGRSGAMGSRGWIKMLDVTANFPFFEGSVCVRGLASQRSGCLVIYRT